MFLLDLCLFDVSVARSLVTDTSGWDRRASLGPWDRVCNLTCSVFITFCCHIFNTSIHDRAFNTIRGRYFPLS